jgi:hypothetical protein
MDPHPIQLRVEPASQMDRTQVVIRLVLLAALGAAGCSSAYWILYLGLPALAALRISQTGDRYLTDDGPRIVRVLRWLAGAYAYLWLLTDAAPSTEPTAMVELDVNPSGRPTTSTALLRLLTSLPAIVLLGLVSIVATLLWPIGAILILVRKRLPGALFDFFLMTLRGQFRIVGYHLSLVDRYPSFEEGLALGGPSATRTG